MKVIPAVTKSSILYVSRVLDLPLKIIDKQVQCSNGPLDLSLTSQTSKN